MHSKLPGNQIHDHKVDSTNHSNYFNVVCCPSCSHFLFHTHRPASEYSSPGRPLSCLVDENTPIMTPNGAAGVPADDPRLQERRVRSQRHRNYMSRTHLHTPPDLPEGYGSFSHTHTHISSSINTGQLAKVKNTPYTHTHTQICTCAGNLCCSRSN